MKDTTQTILDRWYAAIRSGDRNALRDAATRDVTIWWNGDRDMIPWAGLHTGTEEAVAFFGMIGEHLEVKSVETLEKTVSGDTIVTTLRGHWQGRKTGVELEARSVNIFHLRDGKVASYAVYGDTAGFVGIL